MPLGTLLDTYLASQGQLRPWYLFHSIHTYIHTYMHLASQGQLRPRYLFHSTLQKEQLRTSSWGCVRQDSSLSHTLTHMHTYIHKITNKLVYLAQHIPLHRDLTHTYTHTHTHTHTLTHTHSSLMQGFPLVNSTHGTSDQTTCCSMLLRSLPAECSASQSGKRGTCMHKISSG